MNMLANKVAIVTGAGRGIGRAHALELARLGAMVVVNDIGATGMGGDGPRDHAPADEVVAAIVAAGGRAIANRDNVADWAGAKSLVDAAVAEFGRLDIVVNNAAISRFATLDAVTQDDWEQTVSVNLNGTAAVCHWAAAHWRTVGPGDGRRIVNTSSGVGLTPVTGNPMYVATKAAIAALTIASALELAELGVRANALAPVARTRISEFVAGDAVKAPETGFDRMDPANIAVVVGYLSSPDCQLTGRIVGVIGDRVSVYDGWSVHAEIANGDRPWNTEGLTRAMSRLPIQSITRSQTLGGAVDYQTPPDEVLSKLAALAGR